jgi:hypothetical protein
MKIAKRCFVFIESVFSFSIFLTTLNLLNGTHLFRDLLPVLLVRQRAERAADRQDLLRERRRLDALRGHVVQGRCKLHALPEGLLGRLQNLDPEKRVIPPVRIILRVRKRDRCTSRRAVILHKPNACENTSHTASSVSSTRVDRNLSIKGIRANCVPQRKCTHIQVFIKFTL